MPEGALTSFTIPYVSDAYHGSGIVNDVTK